MVPIISVIIGVCVDRSTRRENIRYAHSNAVYNFNQSLKDASIDNIDKFEDAYEYLSTIQYNEAQKLFDGNFVALSKSTELRNKLESAHTTLNNKYQKAPSGTDLERKLKTKRDKVYAILQKL
jgi:hypothetical protein